MTAPELPPAEEWQISDELARAAIDAEPDDAFAFWRGLAVGLALSVCLWIALGGGIWALLTATLTGSR